MWKSYLEVHPDAAKFRKKTLPYYEELDEIFGEATATGVFARSSATPLSVGSSNVLSSVTNSSNDSSNVTNSNGKHTMFINLTDSDDTNKRSKRNNNKSNNDAIAESMKSVVAVLQGIAPNHLQCAIESLNKNYMASLSIHQRRIVKSYFAENPNKAKLFPLLEKDEMDEEVKEILKTGSESSTITFL